jgi:hypothetical protein
MTFAGPRRSGGERPFSAYLAVRFLSRARQFRGDRAPTSLVIVERSP